MKEPDSWITINGQHVPIFEGESKSEATSRFLKNKMSRVQKNKDKYDTIAKFKKRKETNKLEQKKSNIKDFEANEDNTKFKLKDEERKKVFEKMGLENYDDDDKSNRIDRNEIDRRDALIKFTQNNREQIDKWVNQYDDEQHRKIGEKVNKGEALSMKEYYQYLGHNAMPGDVILEEFYDGENAVVANDGKWVRQSRVKEYNKNPSANQDAVYNRKKEDKLYEEEQTRKMREYAKSPEVKGVSAYREAFKDFKKDNPNSNINFTQFIENEKNEKIRQYIARRKTNK